MFQNEAAKEAITKKYKDSLTPARIEFFKAIKKSLNGVFGEDNNQIMSPLEVMENSTREYKENSGLTAYRVIVRFPDLEIKNSRGGKHIIKELYIRFTIHPFRLTLNSSVSGTRGKCSPEEAEAQYQHSHLSITPTVSGWADFCLGQGPLNGNINQLLSSTNFDINHWKAFFYNIKAMVSWESLEGSPYKNLSNIQNGGSSTRRVLEPITKQEFHNARFKEVMQKFLSIPDLEKKMKVTVSPQGATYEIPQALNEEFAVILDEWEPNVLTCHKTGNQEWTKVINSSSNWESQNPQLNNIDLGYFKGQKIKRKIVSNEEQQQQPESRTEKRYTRSEITNRIIFEFNQKLQLPIYRIANTLYRSAVGNNATVRGTDTPAVSGHQPG